MRKVIRAIDLYSKQLNKHSGLTGPQLMIMREIDAHDGITASHIAHTINLSPATVSNIIDRLEHRQLLQRQRSNQDKRRVSLHLTEAGQALLNNAPQPLQEHFIEKFCALEEWEQSQLLSSMQRVAAMMDAERLEAAPVLEVGSYQQASTHKPQ